MSANIFNQLRRVHIRLVPDDPSARVARSFLQRLSRSPNPDCKVQCQLDEEGAPNTSTLELEFVDNEKRLMRCTEYKESDIIALIKSKARDMEMAGVLKEAGVGKASPVPQLKSAGAKARLRSDQAFRAAQAILRAAELAKEQQQHATLGAKKL